MILFTNWRQNTPPRGRNRSLGAWQIISGRFWSLFLTRMWRLLVLATLNNALNLLNHKIVELAFYFDVLIDWGSIMVCTRVLETKAELFWNWRASNGEKWRIWIESESESKTMRLNSMHLMSISLVSSRNFEADAEFRNAAWFISLQHQLNTK